jgi:hypothetical protein
MRLEELVKQKLKVHEFARRVRAGESNATFVHLYGDGSAISWDTDMAEFSGEHGDVAANAVDFLRNSGRDFDYVRRKNGEPTLVDNFGCTGCKTVLHVDDCGNDMHTTNCPKVKRWVVRQYDAMDHQWIDVSPSPISREEANKIWNKYTCHGTKNICYENVIYYAIFPSNTRMIFSDGFGEI